jgi:hypothetical protein
VIVQYDCKFQCEDVDPLRASVKSSLGPLTIEDPPVLEESRSEPDPPSNPPSPRHAPIESSAGIIAAPPTGRSPPVGGSKFVSALRNRVTLEMRQVSTTLHNLQHKMKRSRQYVDGMVPLPRPFEVIEGGLPAMLCHEGSVPSVVYLGLIDILQQYTLKKKVAHWLKKSTIGCCHEIDTEPPDYYKERFVRYFRERILEIEPTATD